MKILIDNGHGNNTPGKQSPDAALGKTDSPYWYKEWIGNRRIAHMAADLLMFQGYDVELLVPEEEDIPLKERVRRVNDWCKKLGKDNVILISVHSNAAGGADREWKDNARGWGIYTCKGLTKSDYLAEEIYQEAVKEFKAPLTVRKKNNQALGHDFEEDFSMVFSTWCPAVLIEHFFHTSRPDVAYLNSKEGQASCAYVISEGVINYINKYCKGDK